MREAYNFSAGPAALPDEVLLRAQSEMLDWQGLGVSVMELSHRSPEFMNLMDVAKADLCELMNIPKNYQILFLQGGGRMQFSAIPLNLLGDKNSIDFVHSGYWSNAAMQEAAHYANVGLAVSSDICDFKCIPEETTWQRNPDAAYLYFVSNETINGVQFPEFPRTEFSVPLVCDMSSDFLSRQVDISQFGLVFAAAQKNAGVAGLTIVIVRDDLLGMAKNETPSALNYAIQSNAKSMYNTPASYAVYMASLMFSWIKQRGGVAAIAKLNAQKAALLYQAIDQSNGFYLADVDKRFRSKMNVVFRLRDDSLNDMFFLQAKQHKLLQLNGHRALGGIRASIYNAMPIAGVEKLIQFMFGFAQKFA